MTEETIEPSTDDGVSSGVNDRSGDATDNDKHEVVLLSGDISISGVASLAADLAAALEQQRPLDLDASGVQSIDTAGLQVLSAFVNTAIANGTEVNWLVAHEELREAAILSGLEDVLFPRPEVGEPASDDLCPVF